MASIRLFASVREAAGLGHDVVPGATVRDVLEAACERYGQDFSSRLETCQIWCNGNLVSYDTQVGEQDVIAILPPVSGG